MPSPRACPAAAAPPQRARVAPSSIISTCPSMTMTDGLRPAGTPVFDGTFPDRWMIAAGG